MHACVVAVAITAMAVALTPAVADPLPDTKAYPQVAFLARNDVPFDAQTAAAVAAQLGAPVFLTSPQALSDAARDGIAGLDPEVIVVAGGELAVSAAVADEAAAACDPDCTVDRRAGSGRDETAAVLAMIADDYGLGRPVLQGDGQVVGDVHVGGTVHTDALTVQETRLVAGLNADRLDGRHASTFASADDLPVIELVAGHGTSTNQPPDPLPDPSFNFGTYDVAFTTTVPGRLHITYRAVFDLNCPDETEWAWLALDEEPIPSSAGRMPADDVGAIGHTLTAVTPDPVPAGDHTVRVQVGAESCSGGFGSLSSYAQGTVIVLGR